MRLFFLITVLVLCATACQKEVTSELDNNNNQNTDSTGADAIYQHLETEGVTYHEDSIVCRYAEDETKLIHYFSSNDSSVVSCHFDGAGKLTGIDCPQGIFDPEGYSTPNATSMQFLYDASGELSQINFEWVQGAPSTVLYNFSQQGGKYYAIMYDTSSTHSDDQIAYYRLNSDRYLEMDSLILPESSNQFTISRHYVYDADNNVTQQITRSYGNGNLLYMSATTFTRFAVASPYEPIRQKTYANLANWFPFTAFIANRTTVLLHGDFARGLVNTYVSDEYVYLTTIQHYQTNWQSAIETKDDRVVSRLSVLSQTGAEPWTYTERFHYR